MHSSRLGFGLRQLLALLLAMVATCSLFAQSTAPAREIRTVVVHSPGPAWLPGRSPFEQPGIAEHVAHYRQWQQQGKLAWGGPYLDAGGGGMMVCEVGVTEDEARVFAQADPAVKSGLLTVVVRPWLVGMKKGP